MHPPPVSITQRQAKGISIKPSGLKEEDAYPALAEDGYGWEKLLSERMLPPLREAPCRNPVHVPTMFTARTGLGTGG